MTGRRLKIVVGIASVSFHALVLIAMLGTIEPAQIGPKSGPEEAMVVTLIGPPGGLGTSGLSAQPGLDADAGSATPIRSPKATTAAFNASAVQVATGADDLGPDNAQATGASASASASALSRGGGSTLDISGYRRQLEAHIARFRRLEQQGERRTVIVRFTVNRAGEMLDAWIARSSGDAALDQAALQTVARADPMPGIPDALPDVLEFALPVTLR